MRSALILVLTGALAGQAGFSYEDPEAAFVTAVRVSSLSEATRIAVVTTGEVRFRADRVHNPERIFFDIFGAKPKIDGKIFAVIPVNDSLLKSIRVAETRRGVTRVVLDLTSDAEHSVSQLSNPERLIIEMRPAGGPKKTAAPEPLAITAGPVKVSIPEPKPLQSGTSQATPTPPLETEALPTPAPPSPAAAPSQAPQVAAPEANPSPNPPLASPAKPTTTKGRGSLIRALGLKVGRIVIDAGHGGNDHGTTSPRGIIEKELVLDIAKRLGALIEEKMGSEVVYTRTDDRYVALEDRTAIANRKQADLFLSIHANSSTRYPNIDGPETFYLNFSSSREAMEIAARENASSQKSVHELEGLLKKITLNDKIEESREFASRVQGAVFSLAAKSNPAAQNRGVKKAPFVVLIGASMPSILVEIGFLTNRQEEALLKRPDYRQRLAEALLGGVTQYAQTLSHYQPTPKEPKAGRAGPETLPIAGSLK